jgi:serine/threonine protein kinase
VLQDIGNGPGSLPTRLCYPATPLGRGQVFAGYTILRMLGSGGMGEVYLAQHPRLPRKDGVADRSFTR